MSKETRPSSSALDAIDSAQRRNDPDKQTVRLVAHSHRSEAGALIWRNLSKFADAGLTVRATFTAVGSKEELADAVMQYDEAFGAGAATNKVRIAPARKRRRPASEMINVADTALVIVAASNLADVPAIELDQTTRKERALAFDLAEATAGPIPEDVERRAEKKLRRAQEQARNR